MRVVWKVMCVLEVFLLGCKYSLLYMGRPVTGGIGGFVLVCFL